MVLLHTPDKQNNFHAPNFSLLGTDDKKHTLKDCMSENGLLVMFICNHCPYILAIIERLSNTCKTLQGDGIGCVAIMSNDAQSYPADSFVNMKPFAKEYDFTFPYLIDETQEVAKAYSAVCTPDFFGFDKNGLLQYRGRLDSAANKPVDDSTTPELLNAMRAIKNNKTPKTQTPSMGCSIKWR